MLIGDSRMRWSDHRGMDHGRCKDVEKDASSGEESNEEKYDS